MPAVKNSIIFCFVHITQFYPDRPDPILSGMTRPGPDLHSCLPTQLYRAGYFQVNSVRNASLRKINRLWVDICVKTTQHRPRSGEQVVISKDLVFDSIL